MTVFFNLEKSELEIIMSETFEINAQSRADGGKGASRRLRHGGLVPGIVYGGRSKPTLISMVHNDLALHLEHEAFYSHILTLNLDGKPEQVILKDLQRHPSKSLVLHADFQRVLAKSKIRTSVPVHFIGEDVSPGLKAGGGISYNITAVEITCLPKDLPEYLEVDVSEMEIGDTVHLSGLKLPSGVEIPALAQGEEQDMTVVTIHSGHGDMDVEPAEEIEGEAVGEAVGEAAGEAVGEAGDEE